MYFTEDELIKQLDGDLKTIEGYHKYILYQNTGYDGEAIRKEIKHVLKKIKKGKYDKIIIPEGRDE